MASGLLWVTCATPGNLSFLTHCAALTANLRCAQSTPGCGLKQAATRQLRFVLYVSVCDRCSPDRQHLFTHPRADERPAKPLRNMRTFLGLGAQVRCRSVALRIPHTLPRTLLGTCGWVHGRHRIDGHAAAAFFRGKTPTPNPPLAAKPCHFGLTRTQANL